MIKIPVLFHGTTRESAKLLLKKGWAPRKQFAPTANGGRPQFLYVSTGWQDALWFAEQMGEDTVLAIHDITRDMVGIDPEDGMGGTVEEELAKAKKIKFPAKLTIRVPIGPSHFRLFAIDDRRP